MAAALDFAQGVFHIDKRVAVFLHHILLSLSFKRNDGMKGQVFPGFAVQLN
jgi:hypothetical protein